MKEKEKIKTKLVHKKYIWFHSHKYSNNDNKIMPPDLPSSSAPSSPTRSSVAEGFSPYFRITFLLIAFIPLIWLLLLSSIISSWNHPINSSSVASNRWFHWSTTHFGSWIFCCRPHEVICFFWISILTLWQWIRDELFPWWIPSADPLHRFSFYSLLGHTSCKYLPPFSLMPCNPTLL